MKAYLLTPQSEQDLEEIHDFIAEDNPSAALDFINFLEEKFLAITRDASNGKE
jgi:plasmid stabilization system protein ParE